MNVLMSIKPKDAMNIFEGVKKFELRRKVFKKSKCDKVIVYASRPLRKIIGEFEVEDIIKAPIAQLWELTKNYSCVEKKRFYDYFDGLSEGYAIKVKNYKKYKQPFDLIDIYNGRPPQSFVYID